MTDNIGAIPSRIVMWGVGALLLPSFAAVGLIASINSDVRTAAEDIGEIKEALKESRRSMDNEHDRLYERWRDHDLRIQALELLEKK